MHLLLGQQQALFPIKETTRMVIQYQEKWSENITTEPNMFQIICSLLR